ncbi:MAG TPA: adenosylhomocysteinase [Patescibacteria group bacterium]
MKHHIKSIKLAQEGKKRIDWAEQQMPVLGFIKKRFAKEKPLKNLKIAACLHITAETANLARTLKAGGAAVVLCASNPLSTQDDVTASLVKDYQISVFAINGEDKKTYYSHLEAALKTKPRITIDDGADLISLLHSKFKKQTDQIWASLEETTTGVIRLRALEKSGQLKLPVIAVNDAKTKYLFDNRYGTGQSTIDGIIRATDILIAGKNVVIAGYGWCGRGLAMRARGLGAKVIITEVDPIKAIEAALEGFEVMTMDQAAPLGDLFCTLTGNIDVINKKHFSRMKDGAIVCNSGHFDVELNLKDLKKLARQIKKNVRQFVDQYTLKNNKNIYLLAEGRLINLVAAEGHPASVMDMSFATQVLAAEYVAKQKDKLQSKIYNLPQDLEYKIAKLKLQSMGLTIDQLTSAQKKYLSSWQIGT